MNIKDVVEKVQKLLALAASANEHEAANAAARAAELMAKHKIDQAQLEVDGGVTSSEPIEEIGVYDSGRTVSWKEPIAFWVARAHGCHTLARTSHGRRFVRFLGRTSDVQTAGYVLSYLLEELERLCEKAWRNAPYEASSSRAWKHCYRGGFATVVIERLKQVRPSGAGTAAGALVLRRQQEVDDAFAEAMKNATKKKYRTHDVKFPDAFKAGKQAAEEADLGSGARAGLPSVPGKLGPGRVD